MSLGHFLDLNAKALGMFRLPLLLAALSLLGGPLAGAGCFGDAVRGASTKQTLRMALGAFGFLLAAHLGLQTLRAGALVRATGAETIAPQVHSRQDLVAIHGEYESGSTLGFMSAP